MQFEINNSLHEKFFKINFIGIFLEISIKYLDSKKGLYCNYNTNVTFDSLTDLENIEYLQIFITNKYPEITNAYRVLIKIKMCF